MDRLEGKRVLPEEDRDEKKTSIKSLIMSCPSAKQVIFDSAENKKCQFLLINSFPVEFEVRLLVKLLILVKKIKEIDSKSQ